MVGVTWHETGCDGMGEWHGYLLSVESEWAKKNALGLLRGRWGKVNEPI